MDGDERDTLNISEGIPRGPGNSTIAIVNESGLYSLILTSREPEAKAFKKWITGIVLPALRRDGAYIVSEEKVLTGEMSEAVIPHQ